MAYPGETELEKVETVIEDVVSDLDSIAKSLAEIAQELSMCFASGTLIRTVRGDVAVEALKLDDMVVTASGAHRPIKWIGHRKVDCTRHPDPTAVHPVRILANAFGAGKPERDLFVSAGHALCVSVIDDVLVPASALINGATVSRFATDEVTYWHVELDKHDILLANGMPAESFIDVGNRSFFMESEAVALDATPDGSPKSLSDYCCPFIGEGALVKALRNQLRQRALGLNWSLGGSPHAELHLVADGVRIEPDLSGLSARFVVPASAKDVWLVSETCIPAHVGESDDGRILGVCIGAISIDDGLDLRGMVGPGDDRLADGFHPAEETLRWTNGRARLPASLWEGCRGVFFLRLDLAAATNPRWIASQAAKPAIEHIAAAAGRGNVRETAAGELRRRSSDLRLSQVRSLFDSAPSPLIKRR